MKKGINMAGILRITQRRSAIGQPKRVKSWLKSLGLRKIGHVVERKDTDCSRGLVVRLHHLLDVEVKKGAS